MPRVTVPLLVWTPAFLLGLLLSLWSEGTPGLLVLLLILYTLLVGIAVELLIPPRRDGGVQPVSRLAMPQIVLIRVLLGVVLGGIGGAIGTTGAFLPFWAGWGDRELADYGGSDFTWQGWLRLQFALLSIATAIAGAAAELIASVLVLAGFDAPSDGR